MTLNYQVSDLILKPPVSLSVIHQVPSPDSAIHSAYSVFSSPTQSPHAARHSALGAGSPVPSSSLSLSRHSFNNSTSSLSLSLSHSLSRNNSDASSSCYSYGSLSPPTHSPVQQPRHAHPQHHHQVRDNNSTFYNILLIACKLLQSFNLLFVCVCAGRSSG